MVDALDLGSSEGDFVQVRALLPAPRCREQYEVRDGVFFYIKQIALSVSVNQPRISLIIFTMSFVRAPGRGPI